METLSTQFAQALERIEITGKKRERAIKAHQEMRGVLELSEELQKLGIDTALIGSPHAPALELFVERARAARPDLGWDEGETAAGDRRQRGGGRRGRAGTYAIK